MHVAEATTDYTSIRHYRGCQPSTSAALVIISGGALTLYPGISDNVTDG